MSKELCFTMEDVREAEGWGFNCGPFALCAMLDLSPAQLRPHLGDFEKKHYLNPRLMRKALASLQQKYRWVSQAVPYNYWSHRSLVRIQWDGPWCNEGAHWSARLRHTHWIGVEHTCPGIRVYDVNAMCVGGFVPFDEWALELVPWLLREVEPKANGKWWATHLAVLEGKDHQ